MIEHDAEPAVAQRRLRARERQAVVGREDDERVVGQALLVERVQDRADALVERARAGLERRHVGARLGRVGQVRGRRAVERVAHRAGLEELAVGLEEADREEERLRRPAAEQLLGRGRDRVDLRGADVDDVVVAEHARVDGEVLLADERRPVAGLAQRVDDVAAVVVELPAAVREAGHPVDVRPLAGQQAGAAARAGRRRAERLAEQQPLVGEPLDVRRGDLVAVGLHVAAGVVRVEVDDVRWSMVLSLLSIE